jgi:hypothetical protein
MCSETDEVLMAIKTGAEQALASSSQAKHEWLLWIQEKISEHVKEAEVES